MGLGRLQSVVRRYDPIDHEPVQTRDGSQELFVSGLVGLGGAFLASLPFFGRQLSRNGGENRVEFSGQVHHLSVCGIKIGAEGVIVILACGYGIYRTGSSHRFEVY